MNIKSLKTQFIGAIAMVLVAAIAMGSSTYAWFAMNNKVTATGMTVKTQVSNNLFIAPIAADATSINDALFTTTDTSTVSGLLEPVSTVNGTTFYYTATNNVKTTGDAINDAYTAYTTGKTAYTNSDPGYATYKDAFSENYQVPKTGDPDEALGYVDHVFCLKAINTKTTASYVNLTDLLLTYNAKTLPTDKAFRIAVFYQEGTPTATGADFADASLTLLSIVAPGGSAEFTDGNAVSGPAALGAIDSKQDDNVVFQVAGNTTKYYRITMRLWLEGEDTSCNNTTFANLAANTRTLDLRFIMEDATGGVTTLNQMAKQGTYWFDGTNYYNEVGGDALTGADATTAAAAFA